MSFFNELKRRNVFRVGIAYVVVAWLVMQVTDVVINNIEAPDWVFQVMMLVLAVGFPVVMVFAWAFEMTPEGIKKEKDVDRSQSVTPQTGRKLDRMIIGILTVIIAFLVIDRFVLIEETSESAQESDSVLVIEEAPAVVAETGPSVAVLPFVNMSGDADNEYFSDGLTETLLHMLAQLPELRVAARTSSFSFKGKDTSIKEISETLGVAHILEGSVQKAGNRVRITAQLIRADDGFHVWSQNYDRTLDDIFAIQDEIATDVASALDSSLLGTSALSLHGISTSNTESYDLYLKALEQQSVGSYSSLGVAESLFKNALAIDPGFVEAKLALARNYQAKFSTGLIDYTVARASVEPLLLQVESDRPGDPLGRALTLTLQLLNFTSLKSDSEHDDIINELRSLFPQIPGEMWVREIAARSLRNHDAFDDSLEVVQAGLMLDPLSADLYQSLGDTYVDLERFDEAKTAYYKALEIAPSNPYTYSRLGDLASDTGDLPVSLDWYRQAIQIDPQDHELAAAMASFLFQLGLTEEGGRWANRCYALAPQTAVCRRVQVEEARARKESARGLELATAMLQDDVSLRRFGFQIAVSTYTNMMIDQNRAKEAYDFLISLYPEADDYTRETKDLKVSAVRNAIIELLPHFAAAEEFITARDLKYKHDLEAGYPWLDSPRYRIKKHLLYGEIDQAKIVVLEEDISRDVAKSLYAQIKYQSPVYRELAQMPEVAARLNERQEEMTTIRNEVETMLLQPEWNQ